MCMIQATCSWAFRTHAHAEILCVCWETAFNRGSSGGPGRLEGTLRYATIVSLDCYPPMADNGGYVELIETSTFTRQMTALLSDEDCGEFQSRLATNPGLGALIKGGGGIRKIRVAIGSRGKRGGARVIYYWAVRKDLILLLYAYPKNVSADLTPRQVVQLAKVVKEEFGDEN